ncbi:MAG: AMP-binding protein [Alphaproteobacteria bacterium]|nr:AMP-binding protein [Alphaproteobacteria bacterium]
MTYPQSYSLPGMLRAAAAAHGARLCVVTPTRRVSFQTFQREARALARTLTAAGVRRSDRVAILDVNSIAFLETLCALSMIGAAAVPLNYRQTPAEHRFQIRDSGARLLLAAERYLEAAEELRDDLPLGLRSLDAAARKAEEAAAAHAETAAEDDDPIDPSTPLAICYTSGTTGRPKGAVIDQFTATTRALRIMYELRLGPDDVMHMTTPMFHISCLILSLAGLQRGAAQLILPQFEYEQTIPALREYGVTFINTVPTILSMALARPDFTPDAFAGLRLIMYTAAPMSLPLLQRWTAVYKGDLIQFLGQTEDLPQTVLTPEDHRAALAEGDEERLSSVGRACAGVELKICADDGRDAPDGEIGEIATRSGMAMSAYWNLPEETASTLRDGWVFSGDLGRRDSQGYVYLAGRKKQMIIRGGENVYPAEVEPVVLAADGVRDAVVLGLPDPTWGEIVAAAVVPEGEGEGEGEGDALDADRIIRHCRAHLAGFRCPERIYFFDALPLNAAGKVDRQEILGQIEARDAG